MIRIHKFEVKVVHHEGKGEDSHEFSKCFAQTNAFSAKKRTEGERVSHLAIWAQVHLGSRVKPIRIKS